VHQTQRRHSEGCEGRARGEAKLRASATAPTCRSDLAVQLSKGYRSVQLSDVLLLNGRCESKQTQIKPRGTGKKRKDQALAEPKFAIDAETRQGKNLIARASPAPLGCPPAYPCYAERPASHMYSFSSILPSSCAHILDLTSSETLVSIALSSSPRSVLEL
jgi:hypothetical protein